MVAQALRGCGDDAALYQDRPLPPWPTLTNPGSKEKQAVIAERIRAGYYPFHPGDLTIFPDTITQELHRGRNGAVYLDPARTLNVSQDLKAKLEAIDRETELLCEEEDELERPCYSPGRHDFRDGIAG